LPIFDTKNVTTVYHRQYSPDLSPPDYFLVPQVANEVKRTPIADVAEIQEAVTDELKKAQKGEFLAAFQEIYDCAKAFIHANGTYFELKKVMCLPHVFLIFKINFWTALCITHTILHVKTTIKN
jgi:hypothetical protein